MRHIMKRLLLWWAGVCLSPEDLACLAWNRQGLQGSLNETYRHLWQTANTRGAQTLGLAFTGHAYATRFQC